MITNLTLQNFNSLRNGRFNIWIEFETKFIYHYIFGLFLENRTIFKFELPTCQTYILQNLNNFRAWIFCKTLIHSESGWREIKFLPKLELITNLTLQNFNSLRNGRYNIWIQFKTKFIYHYIFGFFLENRTVFKFELPTCKTYILQNLNSFRTWIFLKTSILS